MADNKTYDNKTIIDETLKLKAQKAQMSNT